MSSPGISKGPSFGQSRIGYGAMSNSGRSSTTTGGGLASRFTLVLSRVIDNTADSTGPNPDEDDLQELAQIIDELNQHQDLTIKLSNNSKIVSIFTKKSKGNSLMKKKLDSNLEKLDPQILAILKKCKDDLEELQEQKEEASDQFMEEHLE